MATSLSSCPTLPIARAANDETIVVPIQRLTSTEILKNCDGDSKIPGFIRQPIGLIKSQINKNRHRPISFNMFKQHGILAISSWVKEFQKNLYPWGGLYRFKKDSFYLEGPVLSSKSG